MSREVFDADVAHFESRESGDQKVYVKFYMHPVKDEEQSAAEGRPIFKEREYIEIRVPGEQTNIVKRPVSDMDRQRFRRAYMQFKEGNEEQLVGTPLAEIPWLTKAQVEELSYLRIRTLEQLASLSDSVCSRYSGFYGLKQRAEKAVQAASNAAPLLELQKVVEELQNKVATQEDTINKQAQIIQQLNTAAAKKG